MSTTLDKTKMVQLFETREIEDTINKSEQHFRAYFERSMIGMASTSPEKAWIEVNDRLCEILGYPREELLKMTWAEITHIDDLTEQELKFNQVLCGEADEYEMDKRFIHREGHIVYTHLASRCIRRDDGTVDYFVVMVDDISIRKQTEERLQESSKILQNILETTLDGFWNIDFNGNLLDVNLMYCQQSGYTREELLTMQIPQLDAMQSLSYIAEHIQNIIDHGHKQFETKHRRKDGSLWDVEISTTHYDEGGRIFVFLRDITDRKISDRKLLESQSRMRSIIENEPECIKIIDPNGLLIEMNPAGLKMIEADFLDQVAGYPVLDVIAPEYRVAYADLHKRVLSGESMQMEYEVLGLHGGRRLLETHAVPMLDNGQTFHLAVTRDISERKQAEENLRESEKRFRDFFEKNSSVMLLIDPATGKIREANEAATAYYGYSKNELMSMLITQINVNSPEFVREDMASALHESRNYFLFSHRLASGEVRHVEVHSTPIESGGKSLLFSIIHDITERKQAEEKLNLAASVFTHAREGILITDANGKIIDINDTFSRITGYSRDEVLGINPRILSSKRQGKKFYTEMWHDLLEKGYWYGEIWNRRKNGEVYAEMLTISAVYDLKGNVKQYVALFSDITTIKEHEHHLEHIAHYDALTSLPNRTLLSDRMKNAISQTLRRQQPLAVVYLDLDEFKSINDTYGHDIGDQLLVALSTRMEHTLRHGDTLARLGGDEFVAVLVDLENTEASIPLITRLLAAAEKPVTIGTLSLQVSASLGITFYPQSEEVDADQLLRQADNAMYQAKLAGKNCYHIFDTEQDRNIRGHHESLERIRQALKKDEFVLYYQPKVNMRTGTVIGAEALIRWQHPIEGLLAPALFLPIIENHPLAVDVGEWVLNTALSQLEYWHSLGLVLPISVNIGARQLQQENFVQRLRKVLSEHPSVPPSFLELEILETSALEDINRASRVMEECRELGVNFALDDFGTGYSSLTYLKRLPIALLKIDQSFVRDMLDDPDDLAILEGVIGLAAAFRREVIAEGVETVEHGEMLLQLGCDLAQGYGIARPMPGIEFPAWAEGWHPDTAWTTMPSANLSDLPLLYAGVEHRAWISATGMFLKGEREALNPQNHHQCRFGKWLDTDGVTRYGEDPTFHTIKRIHQEIHKLASELLELHSQGEYSKILEGLEELYRLRDSLMEQLKLLVVSTRYVKKVY
ncbi:PAS domain S-box protein [Sulfuricurvum sp.]|uniref:PAS domain S-box protein n=1 Tax=Sulfuricurvum sp. TaxID=2025608 RepID=UPI003BB0C9E7